MTDLLKLILGILASLFRSLLEAENLVLRQQINVLRRQTPKRPHLNNTDRFLVLAARTFQQNVRGEGTANRAKDWSLEGRLL